MHILFISAVYPYPPRSGGQVRVFELLKRLGHRHTIALASFQREKDIAHIIPNCEISEILLAYRGRGKSFSYIAKSILRHSPLLVETYRLREMQEKITQYLMSHRVDIIHIEPGYVASALPDNLHIPIVVSEHNIEHDVYRQFATTYPGPIRSFLNFDAKKLASFQKRLWRRVQHITAVSPDDQNSIHQETNIPVTVVPNGVDVNLFTYKSRAIPSRNQTFLYIGDYRWIQNKRAVDTLLRIIWPRLSQSFPTAKLLLIGRELPLDLQNLCTHRVSYLPHVENVVAHYHQADVLLAPISVGGGTKYKILEAMATGLPIMATPHAVQGIVGDSEWYTPCEQQDDWDKKLLKLIHEPKVVRELSRNARTIVEKSYTWDSISDTLHSVWQQLYEKNISKT